MLQLRWSEWQFAFYMQVWLQCDPPFPFPFCSLFAMLVSRAMCLKKAITPRKNMTNKTKAAWPGELRFWHSWRLRISKPPSLTGSFFAIVKTHVKSRIIFRYCSFTSTTEHKRDARTPPQDSQTPTPPPETLKRTFFPPFQFQKYQHFCRTCFWEWFQRIPA